jgi:hypothetical protein
MKFLQGKKRNNAVLNYYLWCAQEVFVKPRKQRGAILLLVDLKLWCIKR